MSQIYYTGVGSREEKLPSDIFKFMRQFAAFVRKKGLILRSGHASGSDYAFELGAHDKAEIYLPWRGFNKELDIKVNVLAGNYIVPEFNETHKKIVDSIHGLGYERLSRAAKAFHSRNVNQVCGKDVDNPVLSKFLVCWTPDGAEKQSHCNINTGGTGTAIALADTQGIPVFNLKNEDAKDRLKEFCKMMGFLE